MAHYKSIFLSDLHLGSRASQAEMVVDFLKNNSCENLFLVGDIIDGWRLRRRWYFPQSHADVIKEILCAARNQTKVHYILGNHDEAFRKYLIYDINIGRISVSNWQIYTAVNGKKYFITHGDQFDSLMTNGKWLMHVGDTLYSISVWANIHTNRIRRILGLPYWSLSNWLKKNAKQAVAYINNFENQVASYAYQQNYSGVICGHIHTPCVKKIGDIEYMNCGDFCESCTALVETVDGQWMLLEKTSTQNS